jgi:hypothetical protein
MFLGTRRVLRKRIPRRENLVYDIRAVPHDRHIGRREKGNSVLVTHIAGQIVESIEDAQAHD